MRSRLPRRILISFFAAALLASPALLSSSAGHAAGPVQTYLLRPVRSATQYSGDLTLAGVPLASTNVDASRERGPQSETSIAASPVVSTSLVAGSNDIATFNSMNAYASRDGGQSWQRVALPAHCRQGSTSDPAVGVDLRGEYFYAFLSYGCANNYNEVTVSHSTDGGLTWTPVTAFHDNLGFSAGPDKEYLAVDDNANSPTRGRVYVSWDENFPNGTQHVLLVWSDDNGLTWHKPVLVDVQNSSGGVIYATPAVGPDGRVYIIWNDYGISPSGRFSLIDFAAAANTPAAGYVPQFTTVKVIAASGINLFLPNRFAIPAQPTRGIAAVPSLNVDGSGRIYALWTQGVRGRAVTDVECQTSTDGGQTWSTPVQVNDDNPPGVFSSGASDFFPWGAINPADQSFHVSFYSTRLDATNRTTNVYVAVSTNGGASFSPNVKITDVASNESLSNPSADANQYGDYEGITIQAGKEHPVWTDSRFRTTAAEEVFSAAH